MTLLITCQTMANLKRWQMIGLLPLNTKKKSKEELEKERIHATIFTVSYGCVR